MNKQQISLDLVLPAIPDEKDACVLRVMAIMEKQKGIEKVHLVTTSGETGAKLCFHYNPDIISLEQVNRFAQQAGAEVTGQYSHLLVEVQSIREMIEAGIIENNLGRLHGITDVAVSATGNIRVEFEKAIITQKQLLAAISGQALKIVTVTDFSPVKKQLHQHHEHTEGEVHDHDHEHEHDDDDDGHDHGSGETSFAQYLPAIASFLLLMTGIVFDNWLQQSWFTGWIRFAWYAIAYLPVGLPVAWKGIRMIIKGDWFTEFLLMTIATVGAFYIGEYPEGVTVMLFYAVGELFQDAAVSRAKRSIRALLDVRPESASVLKNGVYVNEQPENVQPGDTIQVKAGERVPLDGEMLSETGSFNTAALTGESKPSTIKKGETVLAGMINQDKVIELKVTKLFNDSSLARILTLVQDATTRKAKTEQFIRRFARIYTPIVVLLAVCITLVPYLWVKEYVFNDWLYKALIFLVISCPCALVISIPLGYFGGIGAASRQGILFKGSNYLDLITRVNHVVMDKTGTLTKGVFTVQEIKSYALPEEEWLPMAAALESKSTHPVARALTDYAGDRINGIAVDDLEEISGHGLRGTIHHKTIIAGNLKLMEKMNVEVNEELRNITDTIVVVAIDGKLAGYLTIADEIKEDSKEAIAALHRQHIQTTMLSGDKQAVVDKVAQQLGIDTAYGDLLPEHKVQKVEAIKKDTRNRVAFVGDGINDAPVLALSDVGMAMGALGSDAAIETADVIIQTDQPSKIALAIKIGLATKRVVWQNIGFAFGVKVIVLILGAGGLATMWEAVFADVGVALLAIVNAVRIQKKKF